MLMGIGIWLNVILRQRALGVGHCHDECHRVAVVMEIKR
jgi:hypothetical protein